MKHLNTYITEYIIKKKLDKPIDSEDHYEYSPKTKDDLIKVINILSDKGETNFNCIDTSKITDMSNLFGDKSIKVNIRINNKIDVSEWDVSNVKTMEQMFFGCVNFNCNLSNWDVSSVENMSNMFYGCKKFEGEGLENWDVSNVTDMSNMFEYC